MPRVINKVPIGEQQPVFKRVAWWIENTIVRAFKRIINDGAATLKDIFTVGLNDTIEDTEGDIIDLIRPFANQILSIPNLPANLREPIERAMTGEHQGGIIIVAGLVAVFVSVFGQYITTPFGQQIEQLVQQGVRSNLFDPSTLTALYTRKVIDEGQYREFMAKNGVSEVGINALLQLAQPLLSQGELTQLRWRDIISDGEVTATLAKYGYDSNTIAKLKELMTVIPSPSELISIAVREGFNDATARQFGYDDDYPAEAAEWAAKGGLDPIWFKRLWRAHWTLPGLTQVREMFNRKIINDDELNTYLRAADIPIFWRQKLSQWFKSEITRVDIRRIYSLGLVSTQDIYVRYQKLGYNDDDAELLTQWTVAEYLDEDRQLTKTDILNMYQDAILNYDEASSYLMALDFTPDAIALLLAQRDLRRQNEYEKAIISNVQKLYVNGSYDRTDVYDHLGKLDTPATFIEQSLEVWDLEKANKVSIPTTAQLRDMAQAGIISVDTFRVEMRNRGYTDKYIGWYYELWLAEDTSEE